MMDYSLGTRYNNEQYDNYTEASNLSRISKMKHLDLNCHVHYEQPCNNYCVQPNCYQPLCSQCIQEHVLMHKKQGFSDLGIKSINKVRRQCLNKLGRIIEDLLARMGSLEEPPSPEVILERLEVKLEGIKENLHMIIEEEINKIRQLLKYKIGDIQNILKNMSEIHLKLQTLIEQLKEHAFVLSEGKKTHNFTIPDSLKKTLSLNDNGLKQTFEKESLSYANKGKKIDFDVIYNPEQLKNIFGEVVKVSAMNLKSLNSSSISMTVRNKPNKSNFQAFIGSQQNTFSFPEIPQLQSQNKILHFFETGSSKLHLINLQPLKKKNSKPSFKSVIIDQFAAPSFHASLLSQHYDSIYLSGGFLELQGSSKSPLFMKYSLKSNICKKDFCRVRKRSSHTLCEDFQGDYVYILGGYGQMSSVSEESVSQISYETHVQKVNTKTGRVEVETSSNWGGSNIAFSIKNYVVKACDEGVELLNVKSRQWIVAEVQTNFNQAYAFYRNTGFACISETQIMLFGGYISENESSNECFHWKLSQNGVKFKIEISKMQSELPQSEGFYNNPAIIDKKQIYAIQNIDDGQGCLQDQRKLLRFEFKDREGEWKNLQYE